MDGSSRAAGVGAPITLGNKTWDVKGRTVGYQALMEAEIRNLRGDPIAMLAQAGKSLKGDREALDVVAAAIAERFRNWGMCNYTDIAEFMQTPHGHAFSVWASIRHNPNAPSIPQIKFIFAEMENEFEKQVVKDETTGESKEIDVQVGWKKVKEILNAVDFASGDDPLGN